MKICLLAPIPPFRGGVAKYCYSLAQELEKRHDLLLLSYKRQYPKFLYGNKKQMDSDCTKEQIQDEFRQLTYDIDSVCIRSWLETSGRIIAFAPDLVILPWWVTYWTPLYLYLLHTLKKRGIRILVLCINVFEHENSRLKQFLTVLFLRRADAMIVHSSEEERELREINGTATILKHLLPVFEYDLPQDEQRHDIYNLLFFGFVRPYKGLDVLLRAMALLQRNDVVLRIVGEFWDDKDDYIRLINELAISNSVEIVDRYVPDTDMGRYFSQADLVVLPYKKTKTSGIIATAFGFRKPVLATNVGGFHEIIREGTTGKLVPPDAPQALAEGILWFIDNRHRNFSQEISSFTSYNMSWRSLTDAIETFGPRPEATEEKSYDYRSGSL